MAALSLDHMSSYVTMFEDFYEERPSFCVVDYLELLGGSKRSGEGYLATEAQASSLKDWAKDENMRVFVLHQTNKQENPWAAPTENSARGAGYTEADFVIGIYQKWRDPDLDYLDLMAEKDKLHVNVLKNRAYGNLTGGKDYVYRIEPSLNLKDANDTFGG